MTDGRWKNAREVQKKSRFIYITAKRADAGLCGIDRCRFAECFNDSKATQDGNRIFESATVFHVKGETTDIRRHRFLNGLPYTGAFRAYEGNDHHLLRPPLQPDMTA